MGRPKKVDGRTEILSVRLDPQTRFMLEFVARLRGQTITTVVERSIMEEASRVKTSDGKDTWRTLWSVSEGERALNLARIQDVYPTYEEAQRLRFAEEHWPFFYSDKTKTRYLTHYVDILWPNIDHFISLFDATRDTNFWAAGEAMQDALAAALIQPPDWPPVSHHVSPLTLGQQDRDSSGRIASKPWTSEDEAALAEYEQDELRRSQEKGED